MKLTCFQVFVYLKAPFMWPPNPADFAGLCLLLQLYQGCVLHRKMPKAEKKKSLFLSF